MTQKPTLEDGEHIWDLEEEQMRQFAECVVGETTIGKKGVPRDKDGSVKEDAPRIWTPELHEELFYRSDLTPEYIREFIDRHLKHSEEESQYNVLRLPDDSEKETVIKNWCAYVRFHMLFDDRETKNAYEAAIRHPDFNVETDIDYEFGQVHITIEEKY